jgi:colanic acid/amylovoran biosynthesis glycosyltransferase
MRNFRICIICPRTGKRSETFIRRHVNQYFGKAASIAWAPPDHATWEPAGPHMIVNDVGSGWDRIGTALLKRLPGPLKYNWESRVARFLRRHRIDVVLGEYLNFSHAFIPVCHRLGIRMFVHGHGYDLSWMLREPRWQRAYRDYNRIDAVIVPSQKSREALVAVGVEERVIRVKPYGVDVPESPPSNKVPRARVECVAVGRMVGKKAPILLLDSFRRACTKCPDLHLSYVGDGPLFSAALHYVEAFGLGNQVSLLGAQDNSEVVRLIAAADIFLQHSVVDPVTGDEEGLPVAILEAAAAALPVVSTLHAGIPEAIDDGVTGYLVPEGDVQAMADAIVALAANPRLRDDMGKAAWRKARARFSTVSERKAFMELLEP